MSDDVVLFFAHFSRCMSCSYSRYFDMIQIENITKGKRVMLYLGTNIKEYRLKKNYTQEQLAYELGVSSQTISRWENGTTYPDIAMLPIIAELFETSIDNLMGYAKECPVKEREDFFMEVKQLEFAEKTLRHRKMLQKYPNDTYLQFSLANHLYKSVKDLDDVDAEQEIRLLCYRILHSNLPDMQCGAKRLLALLSAKDGELENAMKYVNELPSIYCGREIMAIQILRGVSFRKALHEWLA